jgi:hypothetical protein
MYVVIFVCEIPKCEFKISWQGAVVILLKV